MLALNTIHKQDCIEAMQQLDPGSVDLVFADPPFNIGYAYDVTMNKIRYTAGSTHEIVIGLRACKEGSKMYVPCAAYD